jgi:hypothetical protein
VFEEFRDKKYPNEPENAIHVIDKFDIPEWWPKIVVIDWGFAAMTWVGYGAISPSKRVYIYREQHWRKAKIEEWAPFVREHIEREKPMLVKICKSAGQERGPEHTIQQQVSEALGIAVQLTSNTPGSRVANKLLIHEYLRWKQRYIPEKEVIVYSEEIAQWLLRNKGIDSYHNYLHSFEPQVEEDNLPKLQIFRDCPVLIDAIKTCTYEKPGKDGKKPEDVAEFDGDDPYDGLRYLVDAADRYFNDAIAEFKKLQDREKIAQEFAVTQDYNILHRRARALENTISARPIRRYHNHV